jgi:hypothetical protein
MTRKKIPQTIQTEVFVLSRRRCCVCYGLNRDTSLKKGQIAHLDGDASNNALSNLAYLCLEHHDDLDTTTRQSKGLASHEVKRYQKELYAHFSNWSSTTTRDHLLNFLASRINNEDIANAVVDVASSVVFYGPRHAHDVLITPELISTDLDIYLPHLVVLDACVSWGLLTYEEEETVDDKGYSYKHLTVHHKQPVCQKLANIIEGKIKEKGEVNWK